MSARAARVVDRPARTRAAVCTTSATTKPVAARATLRRNADPPCQPTQTGATQATAARIGGTEITAPLRAPAPQTPAAVSDTTTHTVSAAAAEERPAYVVNRAGPSATTRVPTTRAAPAAATAPRAATVASGRPFIGLECDTDEALPRPCWPQRRSGVSIDACAGPRAYGQVSFGRNGVGDDDQKAHA